MSKLRIFIIGPTVNLPELNKQAFNAVADRIERMGHVAVVPHELFYEEENGLAGLTVKEALERMRREMLTCDAVVNIGDITHHEPFAWPLQLHARRNIMREIRVDRVTIELQRTKEPVSC